MEWISVNDRLPENERVLICAYQRDYLLAEYDNEQWWSDSIGIVNGVTHWMPLPEPPKI